MKQFKYDYFITFQKKCENKLMNFCIFFCLHFFKIINLSCTYTNYAINSQVRKTMASHKNIFDRNCSSICCCVPLGDALFLGSPKFNVDVKNPNGKAPMPKDIWKLLSPKPKPEKSIFDCCFFNVNIL